jgi:predicted porin
MFSAGSYAFGLSYARNLTDRFSIGLTAKFIHEQIFHSTANGAAMDIGALFDTQFYGMKIGMSITNYGTKMQMGGRDLQAQLDVDPTVSGNSETTQALLKTDAYELPLMFRIGVSVDVLKGYGKSNLILAVDALHPNDDVEYLNIGCEYTFNKMVSLRAGYKTLFAKESEEGLSLGAGIHYPVGGVRLMLDYAYHDFGVLKDVQKFSIGIGF